jgi:hypothetical protein
LSATERKTPHGPIVFALRKRLVIVFAYGLSRDSSCIRSRSEEIIQYLKDMKGR